MRRFGLRRRVGLDSRVSIDLRRRGGRRPRAVAIALVAALTVMACLLVDSWLRGTSLEGASLPTPVRPAVPQSWRASAVSQEPGLVSQAPAESEATVPTTRSVLVRVLDPSGQLVQGAQVTTFRGSDETLSEAETKDDGTCRVEVTVGSPAEVTVRHPRFAAFVGLLDTASQDGGPIDICLQAGGIVSGVVRLAGGGIPTGPVRVVAWPAGSKRFGATEALRSGRDDQRMMTTTANAAGEFTLSGVPLDTEVVLIAAGGGVIQVSPSSHVTAGSTPSTIVVAPVYVMDVRLVDAETGQPIRAMRTLGAGGATSSFVPRQDTLATIPSSNATLGWIGIDDSGSGTGKSTNRVFMAFAVDLESEQYGDRKSVV